VHAGPSSQATLNGTGAHTVESIYLSPALVGRLGGAGAVTRTLAGSAPPFGSARPWGSARPFDALSR